MTRISPAISLALAAALGASAFAGQLLPRRELALPQRIVRPAYPHRLIVKFRDGLEVRSSEGDVISRSGAKLADVRAIAREHDVTFSPLIALPETALAALERRGALASGRAQPDLAGIMIVRAPEDRLQRVADELSATAVTEFVYFQRLMPPPPCDDVDPPTPLYRELQTYHDFSPGLNMTLMWQVGNTRGAGLRIADCEYAFNPLHEDLCQVIQEPGQTIPLFAQQNGWEDHGTAVLGQLVSVDNEYGCVGLIPDVQAWFFPEWSVEEGPRRATAIASAILAMSPGDVVMLEMQTTMPGTDYVPAELDPDVWLLTRCATDAGIVVVAAAGNGDENLDGRVFHEYASRGDSGAIIVGAGSATPQHLKMSFSTHGSRVNVQGWGFSVLTLGYGNFAEHGGDRNQRYKSNFAGTSAATAMVAAACIALQGLAEEHLGHRLAPAELRQLLIETGTAQGGSAEEHIGPFPNLVAAAHAIGVPIELRPGDLNGDGFVDPADLNAVLAAWGPCAGCPEDLDGDGVVNVYELLEVLANWD